MCIKQNLYTKYRTHLNIDLDAIVHNGNVAKGTFPGQKILSVLKADAYGHGIRSVVPAYEAFTDAYAVATAEEGLLIRKQSKKPILIFGPVPQELMIPAAAQDLTFTVGSAEYAHRLAKKLREANLHACCHLKIDTGLSRSGIRWQEYGALQQIQALYALEELEFTGVYTHFACGEGTEDWELEFTAGQFSQFQQALSAMEQAGLSLGIRHCCSTGGALVHPEYRLDMVRLGMLPMGMSYSDDSVQALGLKPVAQWVSYIAQLKDVPKGAAISYGCTFRADRNMTVALVSCGYADGYRRVYSNRSKVLVKGQISPVIGRVAMDYMLIDVTGVPEISISDPVILLGSDGKNWISAQQLAQFGESVSGEVTCAISNRVARIYESDGGDNNV